MTTGSLVQYSMPTLFKVLVCGKRRSLYTTVSELTASFMAEVLLLKTSADLNNDWCHSLFPFWHKFLISLQTSNSPCVHWCRSADHSQTTPRVYTTSNAGLTGMRTATIMIILPWSLSRALTRCQILEVRKHFMWIIALKVLRTPWGFTLLFPFFKGGPFSLQRFSWLTQRLEAEQG